LLEECLYRRQCCTHIGFWSIAIQSHFVTQSPVVFKSLFFGIRTDNTVMESAESNLKNPGMHIN
jgi:hypothetical protein